MNIDFYRIQEAYMSGSDQTNYGSATSSGNPGQTLNKPLPGSPEKTNINPDTGTPSTGETVEMPDTEDHIKISFFKKRMLQKLNDVIDEYHENSDNVIEKLSMLKDYVRSFNIEAINPPAANHSADLPPQNRPTYPS